MSYCPECGEQVAKIDVFCPFCGISLKAADGVADDSVSEPIVGVPAAPENQQKSEATAHELEAVSAPPRETAPNAGLFNEEDPAGFSAGDTSENWTMKTESVEVPAEVLRDSGVPMEDVFEVPGSEIPGPAPVDHIPTPAIIQNPEFQFDEPPVKEELTVPEPSKSSPYGIENPDTDDPFAPFENIQREPIADSDESSTGTTARIEESGNDVPDSKTEDIYSPYLNEQINPDLIQTMAHTPGNVSEYRDAISRELSQRTSKEGTGSSAAAETSGARDKTTESPIGMPGVPLDLEVPEEPSRFDSVQIIQKDEIKQEKQISESNRSVAAGKTPSDDRSPTTPNIGNPDTDGRKTAKLKPLDEGTVLNGRYEIVRKIGGGGMGAVYLANDRNLGGVLRAVKEMVQSYIESEQHDKAISDFKRESLLLTSLDHPAIPTIFDYFFDEKEGRFYLVMKYISGGDLAGRLRAAPEGRLDEKTVTEWAIQIADVLDYLHNHEPVIVYRDLKPANVMIDGNSGRVMLIDFGIARWVNKEEKGVTAVGTMGYAPPELFSGNVEPRSDIYSLGSTMFHLLTGADPQSNPLLIFDFQKNPRPRQINSQLSDQMERILMRAVEYNAEARFTSAAELRDELKDHLNNLKAAKVTFGVKVAPSSLAFSEQSVFCGFCGKQIVATDVFCAFCGAQQPIAQHSFSQSNFIQPVTPKLSIVGTGDLDSTVFKLEKNDNLIGRRDPMSNIFPEIDLSKYDPQTKISRRHARVWREGNSFLVEDLGSSNGTTLLSSMSDSVRLLPHQPHTLTNGDRIRVGDTMLHFTVG
jgi:serine/threonine-protein kinase